MNRTVTRWAKARVLNCAALADWVDDQPNDFVIEMDDPKIVGLLDTPLVLMRKDFFKIRAMGTDLGKMNQGNVRQAALLVQRLAKEQGDHTLDAACEILVKLVEG